MHFSVRLGLIAISLAFAFSCRADSARAQEQANIVRTDFGVARIVENIRGKCLFFEAREMHCSQADIFQIGQRDLLRLESYTLIFVFVGCGGSACQDPDTYFLTLSRAGATFYRPTVTGRWASGPIIRDGPNAFRVSLPPIDGKQAQLSFRDGLFSVSEQEVRRGRVTGQPLCREMHLALSECINNNDACSEGVSALSRVGMSSFNAASRLVEGFPWQVADRMCRLACVRQSVPSYTEFSRGVCRRPSS